MQHEHVNRPLVNQFGEQKVSLNILNKAQFQDKSFLQPFCKSLPSKCIAYLSMGKDKPSHHEIFHRDTNHRWNIQQEFPSTKKNSKHTTKPSNNPSQPAKS